MEILIFIGIKRLPWVRLYWENNQELFCCLMYRKIMGRCKFEDIYIPYASALLCEIQCTVVIHSKVSNYQMASWGDLTKVWFCFTAHLDRYLTYDEMMIVYSRRDCLMLIYMPLRADKIQDQYLECLWYSDTILFEFHCVLGEGACCCNGGGRRARCCNGIFSCISRLCIRYWFLWGCGIGV